MRNKIIVCGLNGVGKSTLGRKLAEALQYQFMDIEDYYFPGKDADYVYGNARTKEEVIGLLRQDMARYDNFILAAVKGDYGEEIVSMFTCAVLLTAPGETRAKRVKDRAVQKFGERVSPGGDLYEREKVFWEMTGRRLELEVEEWLEAVGIPVISVLLGKKKRQKFTPPLCAELIESYAISPSEYKMSPSYSHRVCC